MAVEKIVGTDVLLPDPNLVKILSFTLMLAKRRS